MASSKGGRRAQQQREEEQEIMMQSRDLTKFRQVFEPYEAEGGIRLEIVLEQIMTLCTSRGEELPLDMREKIIHRADSDRNGRLKYDEFVHLMTEGEGRDLKAIPLTGFQKFVRTAVSTVVPQGLKASDGETDVVEDYTDHYNCCPPPLFMIIISIVELSVFIGYIVDQSNRNVSTTMISGAPTYSPLIYQPARRYEAWRFLSYMFIHDGYKHIISNLIFQLLLGVPLEMVHKFWRVGIVYCLGVIAGSMATSILDPWTLLCGASGGCYALIGAHFAIVIMNWKDMTHDWMSGPVKFLLSAPVRLAFWSLYAAVDTGVAIYTRYFSGAEVRTAFAAHFAGAIAGVLIGIPVLKNFKVYPWERILFWVSLVVYLVLVLFAICFNGFYVSYYPPTDWRHLTTCCTYPCNSFPRCRNYTVPH